MFLWLGVICALMMAAVLESEGFLRHPSSAGSAARSGFSQLAASKAKTKTASKIITVIDQHALHAGHREFKLQIESQKDLQDVLREFGAFGLLDDQPLLHRSYKSLASNQTYTIMMKPMFHPEWCEGNGQQEQNQTNSSEYR